MDRLGLTPLPCSLDPLPGESLSGFLLRLAHRLQISPMRLARLTGSIRRPTDSVLGRRLLLDLDISRFAQATRLTEDEAAELTLRPWKNRYPPITRALVSRDPRGTREDWLFNNFPRYCPECLAGDGSPVQQQYGGTWKKIRHLPIAFICPTHEVFLKHGCQRPHELQRTLPHLITQAADNTLTQASADSRSQAKARTRPRAKAGEAVPAESAWTRPTTRGHFPAPT
ncbi:TniQ family protein [Streptomyces sp. NPDC102274]|uniref:TniQ family protein n=1 Tax=Streptomyces sp. NPDC102274 TaxID=3366151 RepID=UPI0038181D87